MDRIGGDMYMYSPVDKGNSDISFNGKNGNPEIQFDFENGATPNILIDLSSDDAKTVDDRFFENSRIPNQEIILTRHLSDSICETLGNPGNPINPVFALYDGVYWMHDPRFVSTFDCIILIMSSNH
jgi:hypothetical protein